MMAQRGDGRLGSVHGALITGPGQISAVQLVVVEYQREYWLLYTAVWVKEAKDYFSEFPLCQHLYVIYYIPEAQVTETDTESWAQSGDSKGRVDDTDSTLTF